MKAKLAGASLAMLVALLGLYESSNKPQLMPYKDPVGIWTECYGHTGSDVVPGRKNTPAQCEAKLVADLAAAELIVDRCYPGIQGNPKAAMMSLAFNVGPGGRGVKDGVCTLKTGNTPSMRRKFAAGDIAGMCNGITAWGNPPLPGIIKRRAAERELCLKE